MPYKSRSDKIFTHAKATVRFRRVEKKQVSKMLVPMTDSFPVEHRVFTDKCIKKPVGGINSRQPVRIHYSPQNGVKSVNYLE